MLYFQELYNMYSTQLYNFDNNKIYPYIENAVYIDKDNVSTAFENENTLYIIDDIITSENEITVNIPGNSILKFNHNSRFEGNNITLSLGNNVLIDARLEPIFKDCAIEGSMLNNEIPVEWFGAKGDGITDDSLAINNCIKYTGSNTVVLGKNTYYITNSIQFTNDNTNSSNSGKALKCYGIILGDSTLSHILIINIEDFKLDINHIKAYNHGISCASSPVYFNINIIESLLNEQDFVNKHYALSFEQSIIDSVFNISKIDNYFYGITCNNISIFKNNIVDIKQFKNIFQPFYFKCDIVNNVIKNNQFNINSLNIDFNYTRTTTSDGSDLSTLIYCQGNYNANNNVFKNNTFNILSTESKCDYLIRLDQISNTVLNINCNVNDLTYCQENITWKDIINKTNIIYNNTNLINIIECNNITLNNCYDLIPVELLNIQTSNNILIKNLTLASSILDEGTSGLSDQTIIKPIIHFDELKVINNRFYVKPNLRHFKQIQYVYEIPNEEDRDKNIWYAVETKDNIYQLYIYDSTKWVTDLYLIDGYSINNINKHIEVEFETNKS